MNGHVTGDHQISMERKTMFVMCWKLKHKNYMQCGKQPASQLVCVIVYALLNLPVFCLFAFACTPYLPQFIGKPNVCVCVCEVNLCCHFNKKQKEWEAFDVVVLDSTAISLLAAKFTFLLILSKVFKICLKRSKIDEKEKNKGHTKTQTPNGDSMDTQIGSKKRRKIHMKQKVSSTKQQKKEEKKIKKKPTRGTRIISICTSHKPIHTRI